MLQDELSSTQKSLEEAQEALRLSREEAASISKEAASAEAASEELVERLNTDNARLEACIGILHASALTSMPQSHPQPSCQLAFRANPALTLSFLPLCMAHPRPMLWWACLYLMACIQVYNE